MRIKTDKITLQVKSAFITIFIITFVKQNIINFYR